MVTEAFWQGIEQFNRQEFYACHDTIEDLWLNSVEPDKTFYQGILQIAVGCYHLTHNNWRGSVILLGEGIRKLIDYEPTYGGINVSILTESTTQLWQCLQTINPEQLATFKEQLLRDSLHPDNQVKLPKIIKVSDSQ